MNTYDSRLVVVFVMGLLMSLVGCQATGVKLLPGSSCSEIERQINFSDRIGALNRLADAFDARCYDTVIVHGERLDRNFVTRLFPS